MQTYFNNPYIKEIWYSEESQELFVEERDTIMEVIL